MTAPIHASTPPASLPTVRLGVVGAARILNAHLRGIKALRDAELADVRVTAIAARRIEDAQTFRLRGEGPPPRPPVSTNERDPLGAPHLYASDLHPDTLPALYDDWQTMLESDDVDAVLILAPVGLHHTIALEAIAAGKHVLIEKPFAISVRAAHQIVDAAAAKGVTVGVAESVRYTEPTRAARWLIDQGTLGALQLWISGGLGGGEWGPDRIVARTPWRHQKLPGGGGPSLDWGVHLFHTIRYLMGPVAEISAYTAILEPERFDRDAFGAITASVTNEVEDAFFANLRFTNGAIGTTFGGWAGRGAGSGYGKGATIYGTQGSLQGDDVTLDSGYQGTTTDLYRRGAGADALRAVFPASIHDAFALEMLDFIHAIASGDPMEASGEEGLLDLATAYAVLESAALNRPVTVDEVVTGAVATYQQEIDAHYGLD
ncbi:MAG: Gfo/Idh/MocA family oxidoreductase [Thermomicrobiales bacterium]